MSTLFVTLDDNSQPLKIDTPITWDNLVETIIQSNPNTTCIDVLYYKLNDNIELVESNVELQELIARGKSDIHLFRIKKLVDKQPINAFTRLGQLIDNHKQIISSSVHISRCIGILASAIALDKTNKDFDKEFKALEKVIQSRKDDQQINDAEEEETLRSVFQGQRRGIPGFGRGFGGRGHHGESSERSRGRGRGRGRGDHHAESSRGHHHDHHHHRYRHHDNHHHDNHHHGPPVIDFLGMMDENLRGKHKKSRNKKSSADDKDMSALQSRIQNTHI